MVVRVFCCAVLIAGLGNLGGCTSQKGTVVSTDTPHAYADGFDAGCHSGKKAGSKLFEQFQKNSGRFISNPSYAQGWSDGFRQCETVLESVQRETRIAMEQQRLLARDHLHSAQRTHYLASHGQRGLDTAALQASGLAR